MLWGSPLCKVFFVMELLRSGKLVSFVPYFYLSITLFFILSFSYLPVRTIGCNLKSPGVTREAQLLVTIGRGRVQSVGIFKAKLRKVIEGMDYPFVRRKKCILSYDCKKRGGIAPPWSPRATRAESVRVGAIYRSERSVKNDKTEF